MAINDVLERDPVDSDFVGKTIEKIDTESANVWRFYFADGSAIAIEADVQWTPYGGIPVMQVCEECAKPEPMCT